MNNTISYHIDPNPIEPRACRRSHDCAWAKPEEHYATLLEALNAIEEMMQSLAWVRFHKRSLAHEHVMEVVAPVR